MASGFLTLLSFFTRIPVGRHIEYSDDNFKKALPLFTLIGAVVGIVLAAACAVGYLFHNSLIKGLLVTLCYTVVTGGIHLDGTADTSDGLFSGRKGERIFEIMSDSKIGTFGVLSLIFTVVCQIVMFAVFNPFECFIVPVVGRAAIAVGCYRKKYAKESPGMGTLFVESMTSGVVGANAFIMVVLSLLLPHRLMMLLASVLSILCSLLIVRWIKSMIGGMTGDTCGFVAEMTQILFMFILSGLKGLAI